MESPSETYILFQQLRALGESFVFPLWRIICPSFLPTRRVRRYLVGCMLTGTAFQKSDKNFSKILPICFRFDGNLLCAEIDILALWVCWQKACLLFSFLSYNVSNVWPHAAPHYVFTMKILFVMKSDFVWSKISILFQNRGGLTCGEWNILISLHGRIFVRYLIIKRMKICWKSNTVLKLFTLFDLEKMQFVISSDRDLFFSFTRRIFFPVLKNCIKNCFSIFQTDGVFEWKPALNSLIVFLIIYIVEWKLIFSFNRLSADIIRKFVYEWIIVKHRLF